MKEKSKSIKLLLNKSFLCLLFKSGFRIVEKKRYIQYLTLAGQGGRRHTGGWPPISHKVGLLTAKRFPSFIKNYGMRGQKVTNKKK